MTAPPCPCPAACGAPKRAAAAVAVGQAEHVLLRRIPTDRSGGSARGPRSSPPRRKRSSEEARGPMPPAMLANFPQQRAAVRPGLSRITCSSSAILLPAAPPARPRQARRSQQRLFPTLRCCFRKQHGSSADGTGAVGPAKGISSIYQPCSAAAGSSLRGRTCSPSSSPPPPPRPPPMAPQAARLLMGSSRCACCRADQAPIDSPPAPAAAAAALRIWVGTVFPQPSPPIIVRCHPLHAHLVLFLSPDRASFG